MIGGYFAVTAIPSVAHTYGIARIVGCAAAIPSAIVGMVVCIFCIFHLIVSIDAGMIAISTNSAVVFGSVYICGCWNRILKSAGSGKRSGKRREGSVRERRRGRRR